MRRESLRNCINAKCKECIFDPYSDGTWRQQIEQCSSPNCPLYDVRPRSQKSDNDNLSLRPQNQNIFNEKASG